jgi:hypothetical protein
MHGPINVKSSNNTSKWQMGFNSAFKGLISALVDVNGQLREGDVLVRRIESQQSGE